MHGYLRPRNARYVCNLAVRHRPQVPGFGIFANGRPCCCWTWMSSGASLRPSEILKAKACFQAQNRYKTVTLNGSVGGDYGNIRRLHFGYTSSTPGWRTEALETMPSSKKTRGGTGTSSRVEGAGVVLRSPQYDEFLWTAKIANQTKFGQSKQALRTYGEMQQAGVRPSSYTFVTALKACCSLLDLESTKQIHADVVEGECESDVYVATMLVDVYAKCGSIGDARRVFDKMPRRDVVSWNAMILGYAQMKKGEEALQLYAQMQQEGVVPDERVFVGALKACSSLVTAKGQSKVDGESVKTQCLEQVRAIHSDIRKSVIQLAVFVGTMLVDAYAKCGSLVEARGVFEEIPCRNVTSWNAMILGYAQMGEGEEALRLYARMQNEGLVPDDRTFVGALKACSSLVALEKAKHVKEWCLDQVRAIHSQLLKQEREMAVFVLTMLVDAYAKCGSLGDARCIFEKIPHRNVVSWTAMILGYANMEEGEVALQLYTRMLLEGMVPNDRTFVGALKACSSLLAASEARNEGDARKKLLCLDKVRAIHSDITKSGYTCDVFVGNMLVDVYAKCGSLVDAISVFEKMSRRDVVSFTALISWYAQMEDGELALQLYSRMQQEGVVPDAGAFVAALKACGTVTGLEQGKGIHAQISETRLDVTDSFVASRLIDMYGKCGSMVDAQQVFDSLPTRDLVTWSALIAGYTHQGDSQLVFYLFEKMREDGVQPDGITFLSLVTVCSHAGLVDKGLHYFEAMSRDYCITPTLEHSICMVDLHGRAGQLDKAMALATSLESNLVVWKSVLGGCRKWCNVKLGRQAFDRAVSLDKDDAAAYILMADIYAGAHMWDEAKKVEATRMHTYSRKTPAQSWWTDMAGKAHAFLVGDRDHPQSQYIYANVSATLGKMHEEEYIHECWQ